MQTHVSQKKLHQNVRNKHCQYITRIRFLLCFVYHSTRVVQFERQESEPSGHNIWLPTQGVWAYANGEGGGEQQTDRLCRPICDRLCVSDLKDGLHNGWMYTLSGLHLQLGANMNYVIESVRNEILTKVVVFAQIRKDFAQSSPHSYSLENVYRVVVWLFIVCIESALLSRCA